MDRFDDLIKQGKDTDALRLMARGMYDSGKIGHTRMLLAVRVADKLEEFENRKGEYLNEKAVEVMKNALIRLNELEDVLIENGIDSVEQLAEICGKAKRKGYELCKMAEKVRGKCRGYQKSRVDDEPIEMCKECIEFELRGE